MGRIKVVFWDLGYTLVLIVLEMTYERLARLFGTKIYDVIHFFYHEHNPSIYETIEKGLSPEEIYSLFCKRFRKKPPQHMFETAFNSMIVSPLSPFHFIPLSRKLASMGIKQGVISNLNSIHRNFIEKIYDSEKTPDSFRLFGNIPKDNRIYSFEHGCRKGEGDRKIFEKACERLGVKIDEAALIDDSIENIREIEDAGGTGILFKGSFVILEEFDLKYRGILPR